MYPTHATAIHRAPSSAVLSSPFPKQYVHVFPRKGGPRKKGSDPRAIYILYSILASSNIIIL